MVVELLEELYFLHILLRTMTHRHSSAKPNLMLDTRKDIE
jgi:hypothetical protein